MGRETQASANAAMELQGLMDRARELGGGAAPVERWDPPDCGPIPMRIAADGTWHYQGSPINRAPMVRLFARILRREADGSFVLVTPHEKVTITVDDAPFTGVEIGEEEGTLVVRTNVGDVVRIGADHPLTFRLEEGTEGLVPYVRVRGGLYARLTRAAAMDLAEYVAEDAGRTGIASGGAFFEVPV